jgi:hypothetical protein
MSVGLVVPQKSRSDHSKGFPLTFERSVDNLLLAPTRGWNFRLLAQRSPYPRKRRVAVDLHSFLDDQCFVGIIANRFFLARATCEHLARRLPRLAFLSFVCLGRGYENFS